MRDRYRTENRRDRAGIPFEVRMSKDYTEKEKTEEVKASMEMERLTLTEEDLELLKQYQRAADKEKFREKILAEYTEA